MSAATQAGAYWCLQPTTCTAGHDLAWCRERMSETLQAVQLEALDRRLAITWLTTWGWPSAMASTKDSATCKRETASRDSCHVKLQQSLASLQMVPGFHFLCSAASSLQAVGGHCAGMQMGPDVSSRLYASSTHLVACIQLHSGENERLLLSRQQHLVHRVDQELQHTETALVQAVGDSRLQALSTSCW